MAGVLSTVEDLKTALITIALKSTGVGLRFGISVFLRTEMPTKSKLRVVWASRFAWANLFTSSSKTNTLAKVMVQTASKKWLKKHRTCRLSIKRDRELFRPRNCSRENETAALGWPSKASKQSSASKLIRSRRKSLEEVKPRIFYSDNSLNRLAEIFGLKTFKTWKTCMLLNLVLTEGVMMFAEFELINFSTRVAHVAFSQFFYEYY